MRFGHLEQIEHLAGGSEHRHVDLAADNASHVLFERPDVWRTYAAPSQRDMALAIERDAQGHSYLVHRGEPLFAVALTFTRDFPGMGKTLRAAREGSDQRCAGVSVTQPVYPRIRVLRVAMPNRRRSNRQ